MMYMITLDPPGQHEELFGEILLLEGKNIQEASEVFDSWWISNSRKTFGTGNFIIDETINGIRRFRKEPTKEEVWATCTQVDLPITINIISLP